MLREGLRALLTQQKDFQVVGEASDGRSALELAAKLTPDVIVMDIGLPGLNGIEATRQLTSDFPSMKVIALSMHSDKRYVIQMLKAGASGYLLKNSASEELVNAITAVEGGKRYLSQAIADALAEHIMRETASAQGSAFTDLTNREREVLQLLAEGMTSKQIAKELSLAVRTVETHRRDIMSKLDLHSIAALTRYAIREGLTSLER
jgi:DNA-binding NarL/FixJ family response regulator